MAIIFFQVTDLQQEVTPPCGSDEAPHAVGNHVRPFGWFGIKKNKKNNNFLYNNHMTW